MFLATSGNALLFYTRLKISQGLRLEGVESSFRLRI